MRVLLLSIYPGTFSHNDTRISRLASYPGHSKNIEETGDEAISHPEMFEA